MLDDQTAYYRTRIEQELAAASCALIGAARAIHLELAARYVEMVSKPEENPETLTLELITVAKGSRIKIQEVPPR